MRTVILLVVLLVFVWVICGRTSRRQEHFAGDPIAIQKCLGLTGSDKKSDWMKIAKCHEANDGPNEQQAFMECAMKAKAASEDKLRECIPALGEPAAGPSPASGDYNMSATMYDLFSQIAPMDMVKSMKENFVNVPSQEYVSGFDKLGTLYGSPYSNTYEGFSNSGHQMARLCMGDPYGTCRRKYGTSAWQGYSQCVLTGEGMQTPY